MSNVFEQGILSRVRRVRTALERATPGPLLVRAGIYATGLAAILTAFPSALVVNRLVLPLVVLPVLPALAPRSRWPTVVALLTVFGWLLSTMGYGEPVQFWRLIALGGLLYLAHSLAALAAGLPHDAVVAPEALAGWLVRALLIVVASTVLALIVLVVGEVLRGGAYLLASLIGLVAAIALAALLAWLLRRP
jgi:hypothetical protein